MLSKCRRFEIKAAECGLVEVLMLYDEPLLGEWHILRFLGLEDSVESGQARASQWLVEYLSPWLDAPGVWVNAITDPTLDASEPKQ